MFQDRVQQYLLILLFNIYNVKNGLNQYGKKSQFSCPEKKLMSRDSYRDLLRKIFDKFLEHLPEILF